VRFRVAEAALADIDEAAAYYYERLQRGLGREFRREARATLRRIRAGPGLSEIVEGDIRCSTTERFPYGVYFLWKDDEILIVSVAHLHRRPGHWKHRT
jgi:plasmid stabilization system protein ParE